MSIYNSILETPYRAINIVQPAKGLFLYAAYLNGDG